MLLNNAGSPPGFTSVGVDLEAGGRAAVEHLIGHGHTNIGLAIGTNTGNQLDGREVGWLRSLRDAGLPDGPMLHSPFSRPGGYEVGKRFLAMANRQTAIFASNDMQAIGILRAFHEAGVRVPDDIALVSFDGSRDAEYSWPALTTVAQPVTAMAEAAVRALVGEGRGGDREHRILPTDLIIRQSCGCP